MRKLIATCAAAVALVALAAVPAFAETLQSETDWTVTFTGSDAMESNFRTADIDQLMGGMQPGDTAVAEVILRNDNPEATDWYMTNTVLSSLEESASSAGGGAYEYRLYYTAPDGTETVLFTSDTVGGEGSAGDREGLHEATDAMEDHFLLGQLDSGQAAAVTLAVTLDGETQGNAYQSTLADVAMDFAVETVVTAPNTPSNTPRTPTATTTLSKTGDALALVPLAIVAAVAGTVLLVMAIYGRKRRGEENEEVR